MAGSSSHVEVEQESVPTFQQKAMRAILSSIYRRFGRQSKVTSCLVSLDDPRIFHASLDQGKECFSDVRSK